MAIQPASVESGLVSRCEGSPQYIKTTLNFVFELKRIQKYSRQRCLLIYTISDAPYNIVHISGFKVYPVIPNILYSLIII